MTNNIPQFRPILSAINTPVYKLAKYLVPILSPLTVDDYTFKDSFTFAKEVFNFDHNLFMASLDVESLFTNVPVDETIKAQLTICFLIICIKGNSPRVNSIVF